MYFRVEKKEYCIVGQRRNWAKKKIKVKNSLRSPFLNPFNFNKKMEDENIAEI